MNSRATMGLFAAFCVSVGVHGAAYASLAAEARLPLRPNAVSEIRFELPPLPTAALEPEPPRNILEPAAPRAAVVRQVLPASQPAKASAASTPPAATAAPALDLSGVTLSNDTGASFAMPVADGGPLRGATGLGAGRAQSIVASAPIAPKPPALVSASDLSEHPRPPALANLLRANYPEEARQRGLRGSASLRARIDADGVIRAARVVSESSLGFGAACRRTVLGSRWSAPRDKNGGAVATEIVYTCHFEIDP
jgi:TonB family protein